MDCVICMDEVHDVRRVSKRTICARTSNARVIKCGHMFHHPCIKKWITSGNIEEDNAGCPICRKKVFFHKQPFYMRQLLAIRSLNRDKHFDDQYADYETDDDDEEKFHDMDDSHEDIQISSTSCISRILNYFTDEEADDEEADDYGSWQWEDEDDQDDVQQTFHNTLNAQIEFFRSYHRTINLRRRVNKRYHY